jgi:hypothetical protein
MLTRKKIWKRTEQPRIDDKDYVRAYRPLYVEIEGRIYFNPEFFGRISDTQPGDKWVEIDPRTDTSFIILW